MGCNCKEQAKRQGEYENIKRIAESYAKSEKVTVAIFRQGEGYAFIEITCKEYHEITPIEYIAAL